VTTATLRQKYTAASYKHRLDNEKLYFS